MTGARATGVAAAAVALVLASTSCLVFDDAIGARDGCTEYLRDVDGGLRWTLRSDGGAAYGGGPPGTDVLLLGLESAFDLGEEGPYQRLVERARTEAP